MNQTTKIHRPFTDKKGVYDYSSVQVNIPEVIADEIISWGKKHVKESELFMPADDYTHGREEEPHITVLYGIHSPAPTESAKLLEGKSPIELKLGKISIFTSNSAFDVVKIDVISSGLHHMNALLKTHLLSTQHYDEYRPHVTIAYVKKDRCYQLEKNDTFDGLTWKVNSLVFSSKSGTKTPIRLNH